MQDFPAWIETSRLVLREMDEGDVAATVAGLDDLEVSRRLARVPYPYRESDARAFLAIVVDGRASGAIDHFMIDVAGGARAIGAISAHRGEGEAQGIAEVGYWLARPHWGRGYAREALAALVERSFFGRPAPLELLTAHAHSANPASCRVLEVCGFTAIGPVESSSLATGRLEPSVRYELHRRGLRPVIQ